MEAKDTVMGDEQIENILDMWALRPNYAPLDIARQQAEISFKAGIREVVGLIPGLLKAAKAGECPDPNCAICKEKRETIKETEAKLKEWGLK